MQEAKTKELLNAVKNLKKEFIPELLQNLKKNKNSIPLLNGAVVIGSHLLPGSQSDLDLCLGVMTIHKRQEVLQSLEALIREQIPREKFSWIEISFRKLHEYIGIPHVVFRMNVMVKTKTPPVLTTPETLVEKTITHIIGVVDLIFQSFHNLPAPLFEKGSLFQFVGHNHIASRGKQRVEEVMADAKKKKTKINLSRAEELVNLGQTRKIIWKIICLLLRGWDIGNCKLKAVVPKEVSVQVEAQWLSRIAVGGIEKWLKSYLSRVKFYITHNGQKNPISGRKIMYERVLQDNLTFLLKNGISVPAFTNQDNWSDTKKLDNVCSICMEKRSDWKDSTMCWRSMKCPHVMCCSCHKQLVKNHGEEFRDSMDNRVVMRKNYAKYCPVCGEYHLSKMKC
jgi:hypothetical protein